MASAMITTLFCFTGLSFVLTVFSTGLSRPRIVNGEELVNISDYLFVVTLLIEDDQFEQFICGGTLIDPRHVVTSASCLKKGFVTKITVGSNDLIGSGTGNRILSAKIHPYFKMIGQAMPLNDIAVIILEKDVKGVTKFPIRRRRPYYDYKTPCKIIGKGKLGYPENNVFSNKLKLGFVKPVSISVCEGQWWKKANHRKVPPFLLCMIGNDSAACEGNSGDPLLCHGQLTGIMVYGMPCGTGIPDLYVDITLYNGWIDGIMNIERTFLYQG